MNVREKIGLPLMALALTGCGQMLTLTNTSPTAHVSQAVQYAYKLTIGPAGANCPDPGFLLSSNTGFDNGIGPGSGILQLVPGDYTGESGYERGTGFFWVKEPCAWKLTLTP